MGMFKVAVQAGIQAVAPRNVREELAKHRADPQGAVLDSLRSHRNKGMLGGGALGALGGGALGALGGGAFGGTGGAMIAGGGLGALLGGASGAYLGRRHGESVHDEDMARILAAPNLAREEATRVFTPGTALATALGGVTGGVAGYYGQGAINQAANAAGRPMSPVAGAILGAVTGAGVPLSARMMEMKDRRALVEQLVGTE